MAAQTSPIFYIQQIVVTEGQKVLYTSPEIQLAMHAEIPGPGAIYPEGIDSVVNFKFVAKTKINGLTAEKKVYRYGICVNTESTKWGDFEPGEHNYEYPPVHTPTGIFIRASYRIQYTFTDDSGSEIYRITYGFSITKGK